MQKLETENMISSISTAITNGSTEYSVSTLSIPGLRHFIYKSRAHVQVTLPVFEDPYDDLEERRRWESSFVFVCSFLTTRIRLVTLYQLLHDAIHAKSGQEGPLKLQYIRTDKESVLGWVRVIDMLPYNVWLTHPPDNTAV